MADTFGGLPVSEFLSRKSCALHSARVSVANPNISTPPPAPADRTALAKALLGNLTQPRMAGSFSPPGFPARSAVLWRRYRAKVLGVVENAQVLGQAEFRGSQGNTGASGLTSGIPGKLGTGLESVADTFAAKRAQQQAYADAVNLRRRVRRLLVRRRDLQRLVLIQLAARQLPTGAGNSLLIGAASNVPIIAQLAAAWVRWGRQLVLVARRCRLLPVAGTSFGGGGGCSGSALQFAYR